MNYLLCLFICLSVLTAPLFSQQAEAEIYWYQDNQGHLHYTNDPGTIPEKYHDSIMIEEELELLGPEPETATDEESDETAGAEANEEDEADAATDPRSALRSRERSLMKEYQQLQERKKELDKQQEAAQTPEEIVSVNDKIKAFNEKLKKYHEKRDAFKEQLDKFKAGED